MSKRSKSPTVRGYGSQVSEDAPTTVFDSGERRAQTDSTDERDPSDSLDDHPATVVEHEAMDERNVGDTLRERRGNDSLRERSGERLATDTSVDRHTENTAIERPQPERSDVARSAASGPIRVISMKTPAEGERVAEHPNITPMVQRPKLRAMSEMSAASQSSQNFGHVAPPYDPKAARAKTMRANVVWACIVVILASVIALVVWFAAQ
jgi:hypothetical protein